jgi:hypothetical protein
METPGNLGTFCSDGEGWKVLGLPGNAEMPKEKPIKGRALFKENER